MLVFSCCIGVVVFLSPFTDVTHTCIDEISLSNDRQTIVPPPQSLSCFPSGRNNCVGRRSLVLVFVEKIRTPDNSTQRQACRLGQAMKNLSAGHFCVFWSKNGNEIWSCTIKGRLHYWRICWDILLVEMTGA